MPLKPCSALLSAAKTADYVVTGFTIANAAQARGILQAAYGQKFPIILRTSALGELEQIAAKIDSSSSSAIGLHFEFPRNRSECLQAIDAGATALTVRNEAADLAFEIEKRGFLYEAILSDTSREPIGGSPRAILYTPPITWGAFTGRPYVLIDQLQPVLRRYPHVFVSISGITQAAADHITQLARLPISQLVFETPQQATETEAERFAVENLSRMNVSNTATLMKEYEQR